MEELKFFPMDQKSRDFILDRYADEIWVRTQWVHETAFEINNSLAQGDSPSTIIRKAMDLVGNAVVILRIIDSTGARSYERKRTEERVRLMKEKWPNIPSSPPAGLRDVRNDYEHFDARLDQWAVSEENRMFVDMNIGPMVIDGLKTHENLRRFDNGVLYFWDNSVDLSKVVQWSKEVAKAICKWEEYDINCPICSNQVATLTKLSIVTMIGLRCEFCGTHFQVRQK